MAYDMLWYLCILITLVCFLGQTKPHNYREIMGVSNIQLGQPPFWMMSSKPYLRVWQRFKDWKMPYWFNYSIISWNSWFMSSYWLMNFMIQTKYHTESKQCFHDFILIHDMVRWTKFTYPHAHRWPTVNPRSPPYRSKIISRAIWGDPPQKPMCQRKFISGYTSI